MDDNQLLDMAKEAKKYAYAPYSKFKVGAALLTKDGKVFTGCNIENASFGATNCAERTALFKAISEGENEFNAIAVVSSSEEFTYPCGICRQVLAELMPDGEVVLSNKNGETKKFLVDDLLPNRFKL